ncbi:hypothetical protein U1872_09455 [Sphingomonas sp. RB3P16]|uniref:hypothetical protein n=1 Tax=Parasphingomonas frigoris TaxID=3096163 RepID=UPI002FC9F09A
MPNTICYEVLLVSSETSPTLSEWTWRRIDEADDIVACGLRHDTMSACFAEVRDHQSLFGAATVTVNLRGEAPSATPALVPPAYAGALKRRGRGRSTL